MAFGNFTDICKQASIPLCALVASDDDMFQVGIIPKCYSRSIDLANTVIFQVGNSIVNIGVLVLIMLILFNIKSKFTAIGRQEMIFFFTCLFVLVCFSVINDCGVAPPGSNTYLYLVAVQNGFSSACCWALMINGLLGFELWEDGKRMSVLALQLSSLAFFALSFVLSVVTFNNDIPNKSTLGLFIVLYLLNAVWLFFYVVSQVILCLYVLDNLWALGALIMAFGFFVLGQVLIYVLSDSICRGCNHYIDGLFFGTVSNTFAIMMLYKYWDIITAEDFEFSVSSAANGLSLSNKYYDVQPENYMDTETSYK